MKRKKILYLFRRPVKKDIESSRRRNYPSDFFYAFTKINKNFSTQISDKVFKYKIISFLDFLTIKLLYSKIKTGASPFSVLFLLPQIQKADLVFTTVDSQGLPYALYKYLKLIKTPFVFNTIGLCDALIESKSNAFKVIVKNIIDTADHIVSGASFYECKKLASLLDIPLSKFSFVPFGIDTKYFYQQTKKEDGNFILAIGADPKRDWPLYKKIIEKMPRTKFVIITNKEIYQQPPKNVEMYYNLPINQVRNYILQSRLVLILSKQNYHFAGQSTILRCMSCAKTVIFTKSYGTEEYGFKSYKNCILVEPSGEKEAIKSIKKVYSNQQVLDSMGKEARKLVLSKYNVDGYAKQISKTFAKVLKN